MKLPAMKRLLLGLAVGGLLAIANLEAADWLQFRGPGASGVSPDAGFPAKLEAAGHIAWKVNLPGRGLSSAIVVGDRVFVTCASGPQQERLHLICFSARDGRKVWERQFWATGRTMTQEKTCVAAPSPASDGKHVFALFSCNDLFCVDLDGNLVWLRGLTRDYPNASNSLGMASSLAIAGDTLIVQLENDSESFAAGLDLRTGVNRWRKERPKQPSWASPVVMRGAGSGEPVVILQASKGILAVEPATGSEVWRYDQSVAGIASSVPVGDVLFAPSQGITALKSARKGQPPVQLWRSSQLRADTASPVVLQGRIFTVNSAGVLSCGDLENGSRLWQMRLKGPFSATPVAAASHLYLVNEKGLVQVVDTGGAEGQLAGELDLTDTILSTPALSNGALFIRSDKSLWKLAEPK
jgi:hypothetical protein